MKILISVFFLLTGCTYSINQIHTEGSASDVVDETQAASPDVSPTLSIPMANKPMGLEGKEPIISS